MGDFPFTLERKDALLVVTERLLPCGSIVGTRKILLIKLDLFFYYFFLISKSTARWFDENLSLLEDLVYSFDDSVNFSSSDSLAIVVHPFFRLDKYFLDDYPMRMEKFLREYSGPILIMEESIPNKLYTTVNRVNASEITPLRYYLPTLVGDPEPELNSWKDLHHFLSCFSIPHFKLGGGLLADGHYVDDRGCLGYTQHRLKRWGFKTELMPGLSFGISDLIVK